MIILHRYHARMFIVCDLDGTLALIDHRRHLISGEKRRWDEFYAACVDDEPNWPIINAVQRLRQTGAQVEIWSGRSDIVRAETEVWLESVGLGDVLLKMRRDRDYTPDDALKRQWLLDAPRRPDLVFDDRDKVVAMWRREGITCAQVAPGDF